MAQKPGERIVHLDGQLSFLDADDSVDPVETAEVLPAVEAQPVVDPTPTEAAQPTVEPVTGPIITGPNTRVRAGNAMERAREAALTGAVEGLARKGLRALTMADVADLSGLARATLYNHVRDKQSLLAILIEREIAAAQAVAAATATPAAALAAAADTIAEHRALQGLRTHEPQALMTLLNPGPGWQQARAAIADTLAALGVRHAAVDVDLVLRWLLSFVPAPSTAPERAAQAEALAQTLVPDAAH